MATAMESEPNPHPPPPPVVPEKDTAKDIEKAPPPHHPVTSWESSESQTGAPKRGCFHWLAASPTTWMLSDRFDRVMPPHRKYMKLSRRKFVIACLVLLLLLIGLVLGLAIGLSLSLRSRYVTLPPPSAFHSLKTLCIFCFGLTSTRHNRSHEIPTPSSNKTHHGEMTYYTPALGACGLVSRSTDNVVSISYLTFDAVQKGVNPNENEVCGRRLRARRVVGGRRVEVVLEVVDRCKYFL